MKGMGDKKKKYLEQNYVRTLEARQNRHPTRHSAKHSVAALEEGGKGGEKTGVGGGGGGNLLEHERKSRCSSSGTRSHGESNLRKACTNSGTQRKEEGRDPLERYFFT